VRWRRWPQKVGAERGKEGATVTDKRAPQGEATAHETFKGGAARGKEGAASTGKGAPQGEAPAHAAFKGGAARGKEGASGKGAPQQEAQAEKPLLERWTKAPAASEIAHLMQGGEAEAEQWLAQVHAMRAKMDALQTKL